MLAFSETVVTGFKGGGSIALTPTEVVVGGDGFFLDAVQAAAKAGGPVRDLAIHPQEGHVSALVAVAGAVCWADDDWFGQPSRLLCYEGGGAEPTMRALGTVTGASSLSFDGSRLFFVARPGGVSGSAVYRLDEAQEEPATLEVSPSFVALVVVAEADQLYVVGHPDTGIEPVVTQVWRVSQATPPAFAPTQLAVLPAMLANQSVRPVDGELIIGLADRTLVAIDMTTGAVRTLSSDLGLEIWDLAVDGPDVYVAGTRTAFGAGAVLRVALADGRVEHLADDEYPTAVAVDETHVYWMNGSILRRLAKAAVP